LVITTEPVSTPTPILPVRCSLGQPIYRISQDQLERDQQTVLPPFFKSANTGFFSESSQDFTQTENSQILVLNDKISNLEREKKDLQETSESLRTNLNNYVNSLLDSLIQEQEELKNRDDKTNLSIYLENQQKIIDSLEENFGKELNSEQSRNLRKIQKQIFQFQKEQMKKKLERLEEQLQAQILSSSR